MVLPDNSFFSNCNRLFFGNYRASRFAGQSLVILIHYRISVWRFACESGPLKRDRGSSRSDESAKV